VTQRYLSRFPLGISNQIILFQATIEAHRLKTDKQTDKHADRQKQIETHKHTKITNELIFS